MKVLNRPAAVSSGKDPKHYFIPLFVDVKREGGFRMEQVRRPAIINICTMLSGSKARDA